VTKFLMLLVLFSFNVFAETFTYRIYEDSVSQFTPFKLSIEMDGPFKSGSKIKSAVLTELVGKKSRVLFNFDHKMVNKVFKFTWNKDNTLIIASTRQSFKSPVTKELANDWGDTTINSHDKYSVYLEPSIVLDQNGTVNKAQFEISNETVEEACLFGILTK
jgi:hypothetical protein